MVCWGELNPGIQCHLGRRPEVVPPPAPTTSCFRLCRQKEGGLLRLPMPGIPLVSSSDQQRETIYPKGLLSLARSGTQLTVQYQDLQLKIFGAPPPPRPRGDFIRLLCTPTVHSSADGDPKKADGSGVRQGLYLNTCLPQPAMKVNNRGGRSRDGLIAHPEFMPSDTPRTVTRMPITRGSVP